MGKRLGTKARLERRDRLLTQARYGKGGKWDKMSNRLGKIPILGETALVPMRGVLDNTVKLYEATHDKEGHSELTKDLGGVRDVAKDVFKGIMGMRK